MRALRLAIIFASIGAAPSDAHAARTLGLASSGSACRDHAGCPNRIASGRRVTLFTFKNSFWINLHQFLYAQAQARSGLSHRATVLAALADTVGFGSRSAGEREGWERALSYYESSVAPKDFVFDSASIATTNVLAEESNDEELSTAGLDSGLATALREAAPLYRTLWWPQHKAANRAWMGAMRGLLAAHADDMAQSTTSAFHASWPTSPITVHVCAYAGWAGAYTTEHPSHIFISSRAGTNQGDAGMESLFHEALHTMDSAVTAALTAAADKAHVEMPYDVTHALIFFTAANATERTTPGYTSPYVATVWQRAPFVDFRPAIIRDWLPYLNGKIALGAAIVRLVGDLTPILPKAQRH